MPAALRCLRSPPRDTGDVDDVIDLGHTLMWKLQALPGHEMRGARCVPWFTR